MAQITMSTKYEASIEYSDNDVTTFSFKSILELKSFLSKLSDWGGTSIQVHLMEIKYLLNDSTHQISTTSRELTAEDL